MAEAIGAHVWVPPHLKAAHRVIPLPRTLPDDLPSFAIGDRVRVTEHPDGMTLLSEWGTVVKPHPTWRDYYVVRMDQPVAIPHAQGPAEFVDETWVPADRLMGLHRG